MPLFLTFQYERQQSEMAPCNSRESAPRPGLGPVLTIVVLAAWFTMRWGADLSLKRSSVMRYLEASSHERGLSQGPNLCVKLE